MCKGIYFFSRFRTFSSITSSFNFNDSRGGAISNSRIKKIKEWLTNDVIKLSTPSENQYLSLTFLIPKKAAKLFRNKVQSIHSIREFQNAEIVPSLGSLQKEDYMCKSNVKNAYFLVFLYQFFQNFLNFKWNNSIHQFLSLCFGLWPVPLVFTNLN